MVLRKLCGASRNRSRNAKHRVISILSAEVIVKCRFILRVSKPRNSLDIRSFSCIGCRRSPSFNEEHTQTTQASYSFRSLPYQAAQLLLLIFPSPFPEPYPSKNCACLLRW